MNLFPRTPYARMPSMPKTAMPKAPKISMGMPKLSTGNSNMPGITQPKTPSSPSMPSFNSSKFKGLTSGMFKSANSPKMAVVKNTVAKLKLK
jgi:hypothetical protein